jgi:hypothetical protein
VTYQQKIMKKGGFGQNQAKNEPHFLLLDGKDSFIGGLKRQRRPLMDG